MSSIACSSPPWPCSTESTPAAHGVEDADPALGVRRYRDAPLVRLVDGGRHLLDGQLRLAGLAAAGHHPAGRHQLDRTRPGTQVLAGRPANGVGHRRPGSPSTSRARRSSSRRGRWRSPAGRGPRRSSTSRASSMSIPSDPPTSRIVVTPARTAASSRAALRSTVSVRFSARRTASGSGPPSRQRCAWAFISPGLIHRPARSITSARRAIEVVADRRDPAVADQDVGRSGPGAARVDDAALRAAAGPARPPASPPAARGPLTPEAAPSARSSSRLLPP